MARILGSGSSRYQGTKKENKQIKKQRVNSRMWWKMKPPITFLENEMEDYTGKKAEGKLLNLNENENEAQRFCWDIWGILFRFSVFAFCQV